MSAIVMEQRFREQLAEIAAKKEIGELKVRYIKQGKGGKLFETCRKEKLLYIGFGTEKSGLRGLCNQARNPKQASEAEKKIKDHWLDCQKKTSAVATRNTNTMLYVAKDEGNTLWITIENRKIYYGLTKGEELKQYAPWVDNDFNSGSAKDMKYGWCDRNILGETLDVNKISGALTKTQSTQGTMAEIQPDIACYFLKLLLSEKIKSKSHAEKARCYLGVTLAKIIQTLQPSEFEVLVDLIFANSGWKRDGELGGNIKFVDVTLKLPSTDETAGVQVKSETNDKEFQEYLDKDYRNQNFDKFFYVYHTGTVSEKIIPEEEKNVHVWDVDKVASRAIDAGLSQWIIDRAR